MGARNIPLLTVVLLGGHFAAGQSNSAIFSGAITGDGLSVVASVSGARLNCAYQRLDGEATSGGLWLTSTIPNQASERFHVEAVAVGRAPARRRVTAGDHESDLFRVHGNNLKSVAVSGKVSVEGQRIRFTRAGLVEEYSVSMDGIRQDFLISERPEWSSDQSGGENTKTELRVELTVDGVRVERSGQGAQLVLNRSGRRIAYSRLKVTDANQKELRAWMEMEQNAAPLDSNSGFNLAIVVDDTNATYPLRIDPTISDANWISMGGITGSDGVVYATAVDSGGNVYIGGSFNLVVDVFATNIAKWNGSSWSALGAGIRGTAVNTLAVSGTNVYAGGSFSTTGGGPGKYIAKWDGSAWSPLGAGMNSMVRTLAIVGNDIYAGGDFTQAGNTVVNRIAKWDGVAWTALGSGMNGSVWAVLGSGGDIYAGGSFTMATNTDGTAVMANQIAKWSGDHWAGLGSGMNGTVRALAVSATDLYAGGLFTYVTNSGPSGVAANRVAKWNGSVWSPLGSGASSDVYALAVSGNNIYVGGGFITTGFTVNYIARWNGTGWAPLGSGVANGGFAPVYALAVAGSNVYAGGDFATAGGGSVHHIAGWSGSRWSALTPGTSSYVHGMAASGSNIYVGGEFDIIGGKTVNYIGRWDGSGWNPLGSGMNSYVSDVAVEGTNVYAGGYFTNAGGTAANYIAKWNGTTWSSLGSGVNLTVTALAVSSTNIYAGGFFTTAGGISASRIAKWDGSNWSALGSGMNDYVLALTTVGDNLYAGGAFTVAGSSLVNCVARWDGSSWHALGSGMNGRVNALTAVGSDLYAGGEFTVAGGTTVNYIARWDGSSWSGLGTGMTSYVYTIAVSGSDLYAGGYFSKAGGSPFDFIAKWDGNTWNAVGSGMNDSVTALVVSGEYLYAGGDFTTAGGKVSAFVTRAVAIPGNWLRIARGVPGPNTNTVWFVGIPEYSYTILFATNVETTVWEPLASTLTDTNGIGVIQDSDARFAQRFYRVTSP